MAANPIQIDPQLIYDALNECAGNKTQMAQKLGIHRQTVLKLMQQYGIADRPVSGGQIKLLPVNKLPLPSQGIVQRYLVTSAQNNTYAFGQFLQNLVAYKDWLGNCELMISRFTYNKAAYENSTLAKPGRAPTAGDKDGLWYDSSLAEYICDDPEIHGSCRFQLAPDLIWYANTNVLPTADTPLSKRADYSGNHSAIYPHAKQLMESMPRLKGQHPRFLYTTGAVTQMNYIQRNAGQIAEHHHIFGALIVEVNSDGDWWVRQINADSKGRFSDIPGGKVVFITDQEVRDEDGVLAIWWGDVHASEIDPVVQVVNWRPQTGAMDCLRPKKQFMNDLFSCRAQNHHDRKSFSTQYKKWFFGQNVVFDEVQETVDLLRLAHRDWCETIVVNSNHDRHGERWLDEADFKADLPNAKFFLKAQLARVEAIEANDPDYSFLRWAVGEAEGCPEIRFLGINESYVIGPRGHEIECGLHGDQGPDGARGTTKNLRRLGRRSNKGHDHKATISHGVFSAGVCQLDMDYASGPSSWSISHVVVYKSAKRTIITQRAGRLWA